MILVGTASVRARNLVLVATTLLLLVLGFATAASAAPLGTPARRAPWPAMTPSSSSSTTASTGFIQGSSQVLWNGSPRTTTWVSPNRLTAAISKADIDQATTVSVQATSGAETSGALGFAINNPRPYVYDFDPQSRVRGSGRFILTVKGSGFVRGSKAPWNGAERTTEYVGHQTLTADILAADVAARGTASVQVVSPPPTPQGGLSYPSTYYVTDPLPVITSLDPAQGVVGSNGTTLSIRGLNFFPGAKVNWEVCDNLDRCSYDATRGQFVSSTELRIAVSAQELARPARAYVWVENPNGYPEVTFTWTWEIGQAPNTAPAMPADVQLLGQDDATGVLHAFSSAPFAWPGTTLMGRARFADKEGGPLTIEVNWRYINGTYQDYRLLTKSVPGPGVYDFPLPNLGPGAFVARVRARDSEGVAGDWHFFLPTDPDWTVVSGQPPLVTSLSPPSVTAGGLGRTITVDGAGATPVRSSSGTARPADDVRRTSRLTATIPASDLAVPTGATMRDSNAAFNAPPGVAFRTPPRSMSWEPARRLCRCP